MGTAAHRRCPGSRPPVRRSEEAASGTAAPNPNQGDARHRGGAPSSVAGPKRSVKLSPEQMATIERAVEQVVRYFLSRRVPADADDLRQEAWLHALEAAPRHDPARGRPLGSYTALVIKRQLGRAISRWLAVPTISAFAAARGKGRELQGRVDYEDGSVVRLVHPGEDPERAMILAEASAMRAEILGAHQQIMWCSGKLVGKRRDYKARWIGRALVQGEFTRAELQLAMEAQ